MPTYEWVEAFSRDLKQLTPAHRKAFAAAVALFVADLEKGKGFRKSLRVKKMQGHPNIYEFTWAPDGRATWQFGDPIHEGEPHVIWRRVGTHKIFNRP